MLSGPCGLVFWLQVMKLWFNKSPWRRGPTRELMCWAVSWVLLPQLGAGFSLCEGPHQPSPAVPTSSNLFFTQSLAFKYRMNQCLDLFCGEINLPGQAQYSWCVSCCVWPGKALVSEKQKRQKNVKSSLNDFSELCLKCVVESISSDS